MQRITVDWTQCTGCRMCMTACSLTHDGECGPTGSRIWPMHFSEQAQYVPVVCTQCVEAWCLKACPARAISRDHDTGRVLVDRSRCTGCRACVMACPFGAAVFHTPSHVAIKCDECEGDPVCVKACATRAIRYEEQGSAPERTRQAFAARLLSSTE